MVELGHLGDHQPDEEPALRCLASPDGGREPGVPPGGWQTPEDNKRVLRSVIRAVWPDRELKWPAFLWGWAVLRITDPYANNRLPRALRNALTHWLYRQRKPPLPQFGPPHQRRRR